jgi:hypothetical protein
MPYASASEGTRVRRSGFLNAVARRIVCKSVMLSGSWEACVSNTASAEAGDQGLFMMVV